MHQSKAEDPVAVTPSPAHGRPTFTDICFMLLLFAILLLVAYTSVIGYQDAMRIEATKKNGEAWVKWFKESREQDAATGKLPAECRATAHSAKEGGEADKTGLSSWGQCLEALQRANVPVAMQINPFTGAPEKRVAKCDPKDLKLVGATVLEKLVPTAPGSAVAAIASELLAADNISKKMQIRVTVCDKGAYPIRIGETDF